VPITVASRLGGRHGRCHLAPAHVPVSVTPRPARARRRWDAVSPAAVAAAPGCHRGVVPAGAGCPRSLPSSSDGFTPADRL